MKSWKVIILISLVLFGKSWIIVVPEKKSFRELLHRVYNSKSAAMTKKWYGIGSLVDMVWQ